MRNRRALFVTYYYPPMGGAGSLRMHHLSRGLALLGWEVAVLTVEDVPHPYSDPALLEDAPPGLRVVRTESRDPLRLLRRFRPGSAAEVPEAPSGSAVGAGSPLLDLARKAGKYVSFPDTRRGWIGPAVAEGVRLLREFAPEVMISSSPPASAHVAAMRIREPARVPWVADFRDPLALFLYPSLYPTAWHRRRIADLERRILESADGVVANTPGMATYFRKRVPGIADRSAVITNGFDPRLFETAVAPEPGFVLLHTGSLGEERHLGTFFEGLEQASRERWGLLDRFRLRLVGEIRGQVRRQIDEFERKHGEGGRKIVEVLPAVPYAEAAHEMQRASALLLVQHTGSGAEISVPCKLYDYLGARRPILALCPPGDARNLLRDHPAAFIADFDNPGMIGGRSGELDARLTESRGGRRSPDEWAEEYAWPKKVSELDNLLDSIAGRKPEETG